MRIRFRDLEVVGFPLDVFLSEKYHKGRAEDDPIYLSPLNPSS